MASTAFSREKLMSETRDLKSFLAQMSQHQIRFDADMLCCFCASCPSMTALDKPEDFRGMGPSSQVCDTTIRFGWCVTKRRNVTADFWCAAFAPKDQAGILKGDEG